MRIRMHTFWHTCSLWSFLQIHKEGREGMGHDSSTTESHCLSFIGLSQIDVSYLLYSLSQYPEMLIFFHNLHHLCLFHWEAGHRSPHTAFLEMDICVCPLTISFPQLFWCLGTSLMTKEFVTGAIILPFRIHFRFRWPICIFLLCAMRSLTKNPSSLSKHMPHLKDNYCQRYILEND